MGNASTRLLLSPRQYRLRLALFGALLYVCHKLLGPTLLRMLARWHYAHTAARPTLLYRATPENEKLLARCATLTQKKFYPPWYLSNGHLQTVRLAGETLAPAIAYRRQLLDLPDGGVVSLDWALLPDADSNTDASTAIVSDEESVKATVASATSSWIEGVKPTGRTVILLPGLTGGSPEVYIRNTIAQLHTLGWQCVVLNARGCAKTPVRTAQLFCTAYTDDLRFVLQQLTLKYDFAHEAFVGVGFSMGSNVLVKYLGEEGEESSLTAGVSVGNPFDLVKVAANFSETWMNRLTYDKVINGNMRKLFFQNSNAHEKFEGYPGMDMEAIKQSRTVRNFDDQFTKVAFDYETVDSYYEDASSVKKLGDVRVPLLCISAKDDPISISSALPSRADVEANPNVLLCVTNGGGHLGFYESPHPDADEQDEDKTCGRKKLAMWSVTAIAEFAEAVRLSKQEAAEK